jgi:DNA-binding SARP family transcriptional activator
MSISIQLIGEIAIEAPPGERRLLSGTQAQVALARLALERVSGTSRDQLADTIWPDELPSTWASALRSVVSRVRSFVAPVMDDGTEPLVSRAGSYRFCLPESASIDIEVGESLMEGAVYALSDGRLVEAQAMAERAIGLLKGPFLPDHDSEWVSGVRERLQESLVVGLETASNAAAELGHGQAAQAHADEAIRRQPLRESAYRCRMRAQMATGNRADALNTYNRLRRLLADDLGVDPCPETEDLYLYLLSPEPPSSGDETVAPLLGSRSPLVGRKAELQRLADAWQQVSAKRAQVVLVTGEPGIGKTRLIVEAAREVTRAGHVVLFAECGRSPGRPFQAILDAVGGYLAATPDDLQPAINRSTRDALNALLAGSASSPLSTADTTSALMTLMETVRAIAARRPIMLVLDNLDLADEHTLVCLRYAIRRCADCRLMAVGTAVSAGRASGAFGSVLHGLAMSGVLTHVPLWGLGEVDVRRMIRDAFPDRPLEERPVALDVVEQTGGNPFLVREVLRWGEHDDDVPSSIVTYTRHRLASLDDAQSALVRLAAAAASRFEPDILAAAAGRAEDEAAALFDALVDEGLFSECGGDGDLSSLLRFTHGVVRTAVYEQEDLAQRRRHHSRLADALDRRRNPKDTHAIARHRLAATAARVDEEAMLWAWQAAATAPPQEAVALFSKASELVPRGQPALHSEALTKLGLAQAEVGMVEAAQTLFDAAVSALACDRLDLAAAAALALGGGGPFGVAREAAALADQILHRAEAALGKGGGRPGGEVDAVLLGRILAWQLTRSAEVRASELVISTATSALAAELAVLQGPLRIERRAQIAGDLSAIARAQDDLTLLALAAHHEAMAAALVGDGFAVEAALREMVSCRSAVDEVDQLLQDYHAARALAGGSLDPVTPDRLRLVNDARPAAGRRLPEGSGLAGVLPPPGAFAGSNELASAWLDGAGAIRSERSIPGGCLEAAESALRATLAGDGGLAHIIVRGLVESEETTAMGDEWMHVAGLLGIVGVELGSRPTAETIRSLLEPHMDLVCGVGYRSFLGPIEFHVGRLAAVLEDWPSAEVHLTKALAIAARLGAPRWVAPAQRALAGVLEARGRPIDTRWASPLRAEAAAANSGRWRAAPMPAEPTRH